MNPEDNSQEVNPIEINTIENKALEQNEHLLAVDIVKSNARKTLYVKKHHAIALCLSAAVLISAGGYCAHSYFEAKNALTASNMQLEEAQRKNRILSQSADALRNENEDYENNLQGIQDKATALEEKLNDLEGVKDELNDQLDHISVNDSSSAEIYNALSAGFHTDSDEITFTSIVNTSYYKASSLSLQLDKMSEHVDSTSIAFDEVATNVTETLASFSDIPSGSPVVGGILSSYFNPEGDPNLYDGRVHKGIDLSTRSQILPIVATAAGIVIESDYHSGFGFYVTVDHGNGFITKYAHNTENIASVGDVVKKGDTLATTGSTGYSTGVHCHYEITLNGIYQDPILYY